MCVIELGGTVGKSYIGFAGFKTPYLEFFLLLMLGDIESMPFIEALRQLSFSVGKPVN